MPSRLLLPLALAAIAMIGAATPAAACCACAVPCAPSVVVQVLREPLYVKRVRVRRVHHVHVKRYVKPFYIVDQGPVYSGPAILATPRIEPFNTPPAHYPVMRQTYYYPTFRDTYTVPPWHRPWHEGK